MDKAQKVMTKINQLSTELKLVNESIEGYFNYIQYLSKNEYSNLKIDIHLKSSNLSEEPNVQAKNIELCLPQFGVYSVLFYTEKVSFNHSEVPFKSIFLVSSFLSKIQEKFDFDSIKQNIEKSKSIYLQIEKLYKEYNNLSNGYTENSSIIIEHLKKIIKQQAAKDDKTSFYFGFKRDNQRESLDIAIKSYYDPNFYQLSLPTLEHIQTVYMDKYQDSYFINDQFVTIFKEEFYILNKPFFDIFGIEEKYIKFLNFYLSDFYEHSYRKTIIAGLSMQPITKTFVKSLAEKIKMKNIIVNF